MNNSNNKQDNVNSDNGFLPSSDWNTLASEVISATNIIGGPDGTDNQLNRLLSLMTYMIVHKDVSSGPNQLKIDLQMYPNISLQDGASFKFVATRNYNEDPSCVVGTFDPRPLITPNGETIKDEVIVENGLYMLYYKESISKFIVYGLANNAGGADFPLWRGHF